MSQEPKGEVRASFSRRRWIAVLAVLVLAGLFGLQYASYRRSDAATRRMFAAMREFDADGIVLAVEDGADPNAEDDLLDDAWVDNRSPFAKWWAKLWGKAGGRTGKPTALMTATYISTYVNDDRPIRAMVKAGADLRLRDRNGRTARDHAEGWGYAPGSPIYKLLTPR